MYKNICSIMLAVIAIMGGVIAAQRLEVKQARQNVDIYKGNMEVLMGDIETYRVADSVNVAKVAALELTAAEYQKECAEQAALIKALRINKKELESVVATQNQTIYDLSGIVKDTVIVRETKIDTLDAITYSDKWVDVDFLLKKDRTYEARIVSRDKLTVAETVKYHRFMGFLWRTSKVDERDVVVASENPHTVVTDVTYVEIRK